MATSQGVLCNAGFQTPSEALFLKKKLLVIPMKGQYEQQCNAAALQLLDIPVLKNLKRKQYKTIQTWIEGDSRHSFHFPDDTEWIIKEIIEQQIVERQPLPLLNKPISSFSNFRNLLVKKIFT